KMAAVIDIVRAKSNNASVLRPVFITCDPARDTPEVLRKYLGEFHNDIIGLTGTHEQVKNVCKQYRVYFSTPEKVKPGEDYLVDHSIYFYLMGLWLRLFPSFLHAKLRNFSFLILSRYSFVNRFNFTKAG